MVKPCSHATKFSPIFTRDILSEIISVHWNKISAYESFRPILTVKVLITINTMLKVYWPNFGDGLNTGTCKQTLTMTLTGRMGVEPIYPEYIYLSRNYADYALCNANPTPRRRIGVVPCPLNVWCRWCQASGVITHRIPRPCTEYFRTQCGAHAKLIYAHTCAQVPFE